MLQLQSKLPAQGVTIFSTMTAMAQRLGALNLSQGFPDFPAPPLLEALSQATLAGHNQYPPGDGILALREQLALQFQQRDHLQLDPVTQITITPGATIAIFCAIQACINTGDEVIIFDPSYDSYGPSVELAGGKAVHIALQAPDFKVNWQQVKDRINDKTRMIVVNTPHNPTGTIWSKQDWLELIELIQDKNIVVLSDEVYEHLVFDGQQHFSALHFPELRERSFVIGSFGKTFHVTGWKTGYCVASPDLMRCSARFINMLISVAQHLVRLRLRNICSNTQNIFRNFHSFIRLNETDLIRRFTIAVFCLNHRKELISKTLITARLDLT